MVYTRQLGTNFWYEFDNFFSGMKDKIYSKLAET
jgi:hypothetical protein